MSKLFLKSIWLISLDQKEFLKLASLERSWQKVFVLMLPFTRFGELLIALIKEQGVRITMCPIEIV